MKKLLGIVVLGLLLSGNAYANLYSCNIVGKQNIPSDEDLEYRALIKFPEKLQINLSILNKEGNFYNTDAYFNNYKFSFKKYKGLYSVSDKDIKFEIKSFDDPHNSNDNVKFMWDFDKSTNNYKDLWVDHFWWSGTGSLKDYDAHYECVKIYDNA
jgi:hypothetical protein